MGEKRDVGKLAPTAAELSDQVLGWLQLPMTKLTVPEKARDGIKAMSFLLVAMAERLDSIPGADHGKG